MAGLPGSPESLMPYREGDTWREIQELKRQVAEMTAAFTRIGLIENEALLNPIEARSFFDTVSGFDPAVSSFQTEASVTLTVPAERTKAIVIANGGYGIRNTTPSTGTMVHGRCAIAGYNGPIDSAYSEPGRRDTGAPAYAITVPDLTPGGTLTVELKCYASADFTADADNYATLTGVVMWLRS